MANTYFQFKQFTVHQEHTAMKVCTDACLFGAWVANDNQLKEANRILDIGTGTGLLSLMLAQATNANITAIEIEATAAAEASTNFESSPWKEKLNVVHTPIQNFETTNQFDFIVSNPPFFEGDLQSPDEKKNLASHSTGLPWSELVVHVNTHLNDGGSYFVLIPALRSYTMQKLAEANGLQLVEEVLVHNTEKTLPIRAMQKFIKPTAAQKSQGSITVKRSKIFIKDADNTYNSLFSELLQEYYLHL